MIETALAAFICTLIPGAVVVMMMVLERNEPLRIPDKKDSGEGNKDLESPIL